MTYEEAIVLLNEMHDRCNMKTATDPKRFEKAKAIEESIKALEKQIPQRAEYVKGANLLFCPNCNFRLTGYKYCGECGQAVDIDNRREKQ